MIRSRPAQAGRDNRSNAHFRKQIFERSRENQEDYGRNFEALVAEIFSQLMQSKVNRIS